MSPVPKLRHAQVREDPENDGSRALRVENREVYARLRAAGESQKAASAKSGVHRDTARETWENEKSPTGQVVLARIAFLRREASTLVLPSPTTFLHKLLQIAEEARAAGKFDVAAKTLFRLREIAMEQEDDSIPAFGADVPDEDLDEELG